MDFLVLLVFTFYCKYPKMGGRGYPRKLGNRQARESWYRPTSSKKAMFISYENLVGLPENFRMAMCDF